MMLASMGWSDGTIIGFSGGLDAPITAVIKKTKLGLGANVDMKSWLLGTQCAHYLCLKTWMAVAARERAYRDVTCFESGSHNPPSLFMELSQARCKIVS